MKRLIYNPKAAAILLTLAAAAVSCGRGSRTVSDTADSAATADSIAASKEISELPDTMFSSAEALVFKTEQLMEGVDGRISSLRDMYAEAPGIMTFRGGPRRDAPFTGTLEGKPTDIKVDWAFKTSCDKKWGGGSGWTGQPLYVEWPEEAAERFRKSGNVTADFKNREIIVGSLCGRVYFIDFESGKPSRPDIDGSNPIKGTVALDPTLNGNLYVGQGIANTEPFGQMFIDLNSHKISSIFGRDPKAQRAWGAYDSSALRVGDFLFRPGENGTLYKWHVGADGKTTLHSTLRFTKGGVAPGIESSMAVYANYGYFGDNGGNIVCVNLNTMRPVWYYDNHDDTDASPVVAVEDGKPYVYTASEVDRQGNGNAYFVKLDALTGEKVWENKFEAHSVVEEKKHFDGGFYGTPLPGRGDCEELIFANLVENSNNRRNGRFVALDRKTGREVYSTPLKRYAWSSPVALTDKSGKMYVLTADCFGNVYIIDGKNGEILVTRSIGNNFESSPIVIGNQVVMGSRGDTIFKMTIS